MAKIILIAAIGKNRELGKNNDLIWHLKEDMKFFREITMNHKIVMGYNTFLSLPKLLPGREHIVLTHKEINSEEVTVFHEANSLINYIQSLDEDIYIIGGASLYKLFIELADELVLTEIEAECDSADVYFPQYDVSSYETEHIKTVLDEDIKYKHIKLRRIKKWEAN